MDKTIKTADRLKLICLGLSFIFSFAYVYQIHFDLNDMKLSIVFTVLALVAILWLELTIRQRVLLGHLSKNPRRTLETRFWEAIIVLLAVNIYFGMNTALTMLFLHASVVYAVLCGTGHLFRDNSSIFCPGDLINGFCRIPFANFPARIISIAESIKLKNTPEDGADAIPQTSSAHKTLKVVLGFGVTVFCFVFLIIAFVNLADVDANFASAEDAISEFFYNFTIDTTVIYSLFLSIPVGAYLFGLFQGTVRMNTGFEQRLEKKITSGITRVKLVTSILFSIILIVFITVYMIFFISQASYMFSGFFGILPEEFTASEYAVSGFHELINVVIINFILLALTKLFSAESPVVKILTVILMAQSMLFATISASKILLYISRFGYTEARTLGLWGTIVVFVGAALAAVNILTRKKTFAPWFLFSAASFVTTNFIAFCFK